MTDLAPGTDPRRLASAYADGDKFEARRSIYDHRPEPLDFVGWALDHATLQDEDRVLDVGCGPGHFLRRLFDRGRIATEMGVFVCS